MKCRVCRAPIEGGSYCGPACREAHNVKRRARTGAQPLGQERECPVCGMPFQVKRNARQLYCSKACGSVVRAAKYLEKKRGGPPKVTFVSKSLRARREAAAQVKAGRSADKKQRQREQFQQRDDPTPEEIAAACLEIQSRWTEADRQQHVTGRIDFMTWFETAPDVEQLRDLQEQRLRQTRRQKARQDALS